ncbi:MAG: PaaI family thioesterase [Jatrophihabitantaceae bacterium]
MTQPGASQVPPSARLGAALRELLDLVVTTDADNELLERSTKAVLMMTADFAAAEKAVVDPLELTQFRRQTSLVGGAAHPFGPQLSFESTADGSVGYVTLGPVYEGGPGLVHGGILALLLDHAMGHAAVSEDIGAMTTELILRYKRPTPLGRPLRVRASLDRTSGRLLTLSADITVDDVLTVQASATFLTLTHANVMSIFGGDRLASQP